MRRVKLFLSVCISIGVLSLGFSFADNFSANFDTYMATTNATLKKGNVEVKTIRTLITNYCTAVLGQKGFTDNHFTYSADQSVFVHLLCGNIRGDFSSTLVGFSKGSDSFFKLSSFSELGITDVRPVDPSNPESREVDFCDPNSSMTQCNISQYISKLFNAIMNDYTNLKQPNIYGLTQATKSDVDMNDEANAFSATYFSGVKICDDSTTRTYPKTCKEMKTYIKQASNLLSDVTIFDTKKILTTTTTPSMCDPSSPDFHLMLCGLYGDKATSLERFLNLSYNELFYYRLFVSYYTLMITSNATTLLDIPATSVNTEVFKRTTTFNNEAIRSQQALSLSLRMLRDLSAAFPLHIGFLMYQEDLNGFGKDLAKILTPLYTLYDKLRNVQQP